MKPNVVRLSDENYQRLSGMAHPGQSIDGVITEVFAMLDKYQPIPESEPPMPSPIAKAPQTKGEGNASI